MFLVLEGELEACTDLPGKGAIRVVFNAGEFSGDGTLFDQGPRPSDLVARTNSLVVRVSTAAFDRLAQEAPELATPFLLAIGKALTARIRAGGNPPRVAAKPLP